MTGAVAREQVDVDGTGIDYQAVFQALPGAVALLTPDLVYLDANESFLSASGRTREQLVGRYLFDVFPDNPTDPAANGMRNLRASLERVKATRERGGPHRAAAHDCDLRFLTADAMDWPRHWYERRGFAVVGHTHAFERG
ncbi:hypothetical protein SAVIM40S_00239 [Streptomyces avidinii]